MTIKLRNGIFLAPFHPVDEDPTLCIQRDFELIEHLDRLKYSWSGARSASLARSHGLWPAGEMGRLAGRLPQPTEGKQNMRRNGRPIPQWLRLKEGHSDDLESR